MRANISRSAVPSIESGSGSQLRTLISVLRALDRLDAIDDRSRFSFPALNVQTYHRLPPMLADALSDAFGNALVDAWLADKGLNSRN